MPADPESGPLCLSLVRKHTYLVFSGAEGLEFGLVVVEARVLRHEVVVRLVFIVLPQPVVASEGQKVVVHGVANTLRAASKR